MNVNCESRQTYSKQVRSWGLPSWQRGLESTWALACDPRQTADNRRTMRRHKSHDLVKSRTHVRINRNKLANRSLVFLFGLRNDLLPPAVEDMHPPDIYPPTTLHLHPTSFPLESRAIAIVVPGAVRQRGMPGKSVHLCQATKNQLRPSEPRPQ